MRHASNGCRMPYRGWKTTDKANIITKDIHINITCWVRWSWSQIEDKNPLIVSQPGSAELAAG